MTMKYIRSSHSYGYHCESLSWKGHYEPEKRFPHETFEEFDPNMDRLMQEERNRIDFHYPDRKEKILS